MQKDVELKDILILFLEKFKIIFVTAVAFAVVFGGVGAWKGYKTLTDPAVVEQQQTAYLIKKNEFETSVSQLRTDLERSDKRQKELQDYTNQSIYYNLESTNEAVSELVFYVDTGFQIMPNQFYQNPNKTSDIVSAYCDAYRSAELYTGISKIIGKEVEEKYLDELIQVERAGDTKIKDNLGNVTVRHGDVNNGVVIIRTRYSDEETADKMSNFVFEYLNKAVSKNVAEHKANILTNSAMIMIDSDLDNLRQETEKELSELSTKLITKRAEILQKERSAPAEPSFSKTTIIKKGILYGIAGGVIGGVIICAWILLSYVSDNHLGNETQTKRLYNYELLGIFRNESDKSQKALFFHKLIARLEGRGEEYISNQETASYITAALSALVEKEEEKEKEEEAEEDVMKPKILLTGTADKKLLEEFGKRLSATNDKLEYLLGNNILESSETVKLLKESDGVVLIEQSGKSLIPCINQEILRIEKLGNKILGIILLK